MTREESPQEKEIVRPISRIERFVGEILKDPTGNGKQWAIRAGYSPKTAEQQASRLLSNVKVQAALKKIREQQERRTGIDGDKVLFYLSNIAESDIGEAFSEDGTFLPIKQIPKEIRRLISSVEVQELYEGKGKDRKFIGYLRKIKFWDKGKALELMGKHHKLFTDRVEIHDSRKLADRLRKARERRKG